MQIMISIALVFISLLTTNNLTLQEQLPTFNGSQIQVAQHPVGIAHDETQIVSLTLEDLSRSDVERDIAYAEEQKRTEEALVEELVEKDQVEELEEVILQTSEEQLTSEEEDIRMLASMIYLETRDIVNHDPRKEATVVANRMKKHQLSVSNVIMAGGGTQFNVVRLEAFANREYDLKSYEAAKDVLVNGYRAFEEDILYFTNVSLVESNPELFDIDFVNSIDWVYLQDEENGHSYGRAKE